VSCWKEPKQQHNTGRKSLTSMTDAEWFANRGGTKEQTRFPPLQVPFAWHVRVVDPVLAKYPSAHPIEHCTPSDAPAHCVPPSHTVDSTVLSKVPTPAEANPVAPLEKRVTATNPANKPSICTAEQATCGVHISSLMWLPKQAVKNMDF
jgi:hypothetical protein